MRVDLGGIGGFAFILANAFLLPRLGAGPAVALAVLVWPFPAPLGVVIGGLLVGGRIALIALGFALVYRASRVVNFAQGDLGQVPAIASWLVPEKMERHVG